MPFEFDEIEDWLGLSASSSNHGNKDSKDEKEPTAMRIVGIVLYASLFIATLADYIYKRVKSSRKLPTMVTTFYIGLPLFMLCEFCFITCACSCSFTCHLCI